MHRRMYTKTVFITVVLLLGIRSQKFDVVLVVDESELPIYLEAQNEAIVVSGLPSGSELGVKFITYRENQTQELNGKARELLQSGGILLGDATCSGLPFLRSLSSSQGVPYLRLHTATSLYTRIALEYLNLLETKDAVFVFQTETGYVQGLCHVLESASSKVRLLLMHDSEQKNLDKLKDLQPRYSHYVLFGSSTFADTLLTKAHAEKLVLGESRWTVFHHDDDTVTFRSNSTRMTLMDITEESLCSLKGSPQCVCSESVVRCHHVENIALSYYRALISSLGKAASLIPRGNVSLQSLADIYDTMPYPFTLNDYQLMPTLEFKVSISDQTSEQFTSAHPVGKWTNKFGFQMNDRIFNKLKRRKLRVGSVENSPFVMHSGPFNKHDGSSINHYGLIIDILNKLQEYMNFDYELVFPQDGLVGVRIPQTNIWNGLMGMLDRQEIDIAMGAMSVTAERAKYVDFVVPYIDQTGIGILGKKPNPPRTIFKFLEVLTPNVWWSIVGAVICVSLGIWLLELSSPYGGRQSAPGSRIFTLRESLWFAMTSFTPQGGGEVPKSLCGRVMVTAYWLFVVLIMATFSANLSALLTVERMDTQINSLEQMAREPDFKYTVVDGTATLGYFLNMADAEDALYGAWKDITLKKTTDYTKYRVWDYPIKEQYQKILKGIQSVGPVANIEKGIELVRGDKHGRFALMTDITTVRYLVNQECDFIQIGDVFGEHPYAVAVPKGSALKREISEKLMELQKQRFFGDQLSRYLNSSRRKQCEQELDTLGVYDFGGVFVVVGIGAVIALVAVVMESSSGRSRKRKARIQQLQRNQPPEPEAGLPEQAPPIFLIGQNAHPDHHHEILENFLNEEVVQLEMPLERSGRSPGRSTQAVHVCKPEPGCLGLVGRSARFPTIDW